MRIITTIATLFAVATTQACASDDSHWQALKAAVGRSGGSVDNVIVASSPKLGIRGIQAGRAYQLGEIITSTPRSMLMSNVTAYLTDRDTSGFGTALHEMRSETFTDLDALVFHLMNEKQKGDSSEYLSYLSFMPEVPPQPMFWSPEKMKESFAANNDAFMRIYRSEEGFVRDMQNERRVLSSNYQAHSSILNASLAKRGKSGVHFSEDEYNWAQGMLRSRALNLPVQSFTMVPLADLFNHGHDANAEWHMEDVDFGCGPSGCGMIKGAIQIRATEPIAEGDEILVSYGDPAEGQEAARTLLVEGGIIP